MDIKFDLSELTSVDSSGVTSRFQKLIGDLENILMDGQVLAGEYLSGRPYLPTGLTPDVPSVAIKDLPNEYEVEQILEKIGDNYTDYLCMYNHRLEYIYSDCIYQYLVAKGIIPVGYICKNNLRSNDVTLTLYKNWSSVVRILTNIQLVNYISGFGMLAFKVPNHDLTSIKFFITCKNSMDKTMLLTSLRDSQTNNMMIYKDSELQELLVQKDIDILFLFTKLPNLSTCSAGLTFRFTKKFKETIPSYGLEISVDKHSVITAVSGKDGSLVVTKDLPHFHTITALSGSVIRISIKSQRNYLPYLFVIDGQRFPLSDAISLQAKGISYTKLSDATTCDNMDSWVLLLTKFSKSMSIHIETCEDATMKRPRAVISKQSTLTVRDDIVVLNLQTLFPLVWLDSNKIHVTAVKLGTEDQVPEKVKVEDFDVTVQKFLYTDTYITTVLPYDSVNLPDCKHDCDCHSPYPDDYHPSKKNQWALDFPGRMNPNPTVKYDPPTGFSCIKMHPCSPSDPDKYVKFHLAVCSGITITFTGYEDYDRFIVTFDKYVAAINLNAGERGQRHPHIIIPAIKPCQFTMYDPIPDEPIIPPTEDYPSDPGPSDDTNDTEDDDTIDEVPGDDLQTKVLFAGRMFYIEGTDVIVIQSPTHRVKLIRLKAPLPNRYSGELLVYDDTVEAKLINIAKSSAVVVTFADGKEVTEWAHDDDDADFEVMTSGKLMYFPETSIIVITEILGKQLKSTSFYLKNPLPTNPDGSNLLDTETTGQIVMVGTKLAAVITTGTGNEFFEWVTNPIDAEGYTSIETRDISMSRLIGQTIMYAECGSNTGYSMIITDMHPIVILDTNGQPQPFQKFFGGFVGLLNTDKVSKINFCADKTGILHAILYMASGMQIDTTIDDVYTGQRVDYSSVYHIKHMNDATHKVAMQLVESHRLQTIQFCLPFGDDYSNFPAAVIEEHKYTSIYMVSATGMIHRANSNWFVSIIDEPDNTGFVANVMEFEFVEHLELPKFLDVVSVSNILVDLNSMNIYLTISESDSMTNAILQCEPVFLLKSSVINLNTNSDVHQISIDTNINDTMILYLFDQSNDLIDTIFIKSSIVKYERCEFGILTGGRLINTQHPIGDPVSIDYSCLVVEGPLHDTSCILAKTGPISNDVLSLWNGLQSDNVVDYAYNDTSGVAIISTASNSTVNVRRCTSSPSMKPIVDALPLRFMVYGTRLYIEYTNTKGVVCGIIVDMLVPLRECSTAVTSVSIWKMENDKHVISIVRGREDVTVLVESDQCKVYFVTPVDLGDSTIIKVDKGSSDSLIELCSADIYTKLNINEQIPDELAPDLGVTRLTTIYTECTDSSETEVGYICLQNKDVRYNGYILPIKEIIEMNNV